METKVGIEPEPEQPLRQLNERWRNLIVEDVEHWKAVGAACVPRVTELLRQHVQTGARHRYALYLSDLLDQEVLVGMSEREKTLVWLPIEEELRKSNLTIGPRTNPILVYPPHVSDVPDVLRKPWLKDAARFQQELKSAESRTKVRIATRFFEHLCTQAEWVDDLPDLQRTAVLQNLDELQDDLDPEDVKRWRRCLGGVVDQGLRFPAADGSALNSTLPEISRTDLVDQQ